MCVQLYNWAIIIPCFQDKHYSAKQVLIKKGSHGVRALFNYFAINWHWLCSAKYRNPAKKIQSQRKRFSLNNHGRVNNQPLRPFLDYDLLFVSAMPSLCQTNHLINLENPYQTTSTGKGSLNWYCYAWPGHSILRWGEPRSIWAGNTTLNATLSFKHQSRSPVL